MKCDVKISSKSVQSHSFHSDVLIFVCLRMIICFKTLLVHLIPFVYTASISCCICSEKRRLPHTRVLPTCMLTSIRFHSARILTSIHFHSIRMLPHISLCSICIFSYTHLCAACNSSCICFPKSLSLPPCNQRQLRTCHAYCLASINHTKHSGSSEWYLIDQSAVSTNFTNF